MFEMIKVDKPIYKLYNANDEFVGEIACEEELKYAMMKIAEENECGYQLKLDDEIVWIFDGDGSVHNAYKDNTVFYYNNTNSYEYDRKRHSITHTRNLKEWTVAFENRLREDALSPSIFSQLGEAVEHHERLTNTLVPDNQPIQETTEYGRVEVRSFDSLIPIYPYTYSHRQSEQLGIQRDFHW